MVLAPSQEWHWVSQDALYNMVCSDFSISRAPESPEYWLGEIYIGIFVLIFHKIKNPDQILT